MKEIKYKILVKTLEFLIKYLPSSITNNKNTSGVKTYYRYSSESVWISLKKPFNKINEYQSKLDKIYFKKFEKIKL